METVSFIHTESGKDLIVSFAIPTSDVPDDVESLTLLRTPMFEGVLDDADRGVKVMPENGEDEDMLQEVSFDREAAVVRLITENHRYELDVNKVDPEDITDMRRVLRQMNFDSRVKLTGV